ncbi:unnamed protein product [Auanema sp. JU1783]|nr:unnamed protein product [Auanema sp. JU1783]
MLRATKGFTFFSKLYASTTSSHYDVIVIGAGSGGLAFSKKASDLGARVALIDAVEASPHGTTWGIGGTCANVGCIPKKLMHTGALVGKTVKQAHAYGYGNIPEKLEFDWKRLSQIVNDRVKANNWVYRVQLNEKKINYINGFASFVDKNTVRVTQGGKKKVEKTLTAQNVVVATGLRPRYPQIEGAHLGISSDDIFTLEKIPERIIVVGGGYIALETAGFLNSFGCSVDVLIRSEPLKEFDKDCVSKVILNMKKHGVNFVQGSEVEKVKKSGDRLEVTLTNSSVQECDAVMWAIGRQPVLHSLALERINLELSHNNKIVVNEKDETNVDGVYALGDISQGRPELTPTAIMAGQLLAGRLYGNSNALMNYDQVPTTVFTPLELATVGLTEQEALSTYGEDAIEVYHSEFVPFEFVVPQDDDRSECYTKVICMRNEPKTVLGIHIVSPNAAEIIQGYAVALRKGITFDDIIGTVAIHPCSSEEIVKLSITKRSGLSPAVQGCCG